MDLVYIALALGFFIGTVALVHLFDKLKRR